MFYFKKNKLLIIIVILLLLFCLYYNNSQFGNVKVLNILKNYNDLLNIDLSNVQTTPGGIPKLIFKTSWQTINNFPEEMQNALKDTINLNPGYQIYYFDDTDCNNFMKNFGPSEYSAYNKLIPSAFKSDLFRYCILYKYGGIYSDIGHVMKKSFNTIIGDSNLVIVKDKPKKIYWGIHNALICVTKENQFIKALIYKVMENVNNNYYGENQLDVTGPIMMGKVFQCYYYDKCNSNLNEKYLTEKNKIKILYYLLKKDAVSGYIADYKNEEILTTKFNNYYSLMYPPTKLKRYDELWKEKAIYN